MSGTLTLQDYTMYSSNKAACDGKHIFLLSKENLEMLQALQRELEWKKCVFLASAPQEEEYPQVIRTLGRDTIQTQNYVGSLALRGKKVIIHSRFDGEKHLFLRCLLENVWGGASLAALDGLDGLERQDLYSWQLVFQLAMQLQAAWKKGIFRVYRSFAHYDTRMRGQLDIPRHIRLSMGLRNGQAAYRTREYSPDNFYNRLILCAMRAAERQYPKLVRRLLQQLPACMAAVQFLRRQLPDADRDQPGLLLERTKRKISHPIYCGYEDVRISARAVLQRMGKNMMEQNRSIGILLNMDRLWEEFVAKVLFQNRTENFQQYSQKILDGRMAIRPDFYWKSKRVVLDAKNRPIWGESLGNRPWSEKVCSGVREDVYQVLSYMLALDCTNGGVIFPVCRSRIKLAFGEPSSFRVSSCPQEERHFWCIPFVIPDDADTYENFQKAVKAQADLIRGFQTET